MEKSKLISCKINPEELIGYLKYAGEMDDISRNLLVTYIIIDGYSSMVRKKGYITDECTYYYDCTIEYIYKRKYISSINGHISSNCKYTCHKTINNVMNPSYEEIENMIINSAAARKVIIKDLKITQEKYDEFCNNTLDLKILDEKRKIESISRDIKGYRNSIKKLETEKALHKIALDNLVLQRDGIKAKGKTKKLKNNNGK